MLEVLTVGSFCASLFYCLFTGTSILYALIFAFFLFCGYALYRGFSLQEIGKACRQSIAKISNIIIVMLLIGALTASWRASGTIAYLVSYASEIISPSWSLLGTFILNAALSSLIGTSFGTAATMGVVTMSLCVGMGVSPFWAGGAALAGAYVGDRCSPVSTSAQLVCAVTGTELYKNIKNMLRTGLIPFLLACLIYFFVGNGQGAQAADIDLTKLFSQEYILSAWTLIPAIVLLTMVMLKADIKLTMIASIASAFVTALFLRDLGSIELCKILFSGYQAASPEVGRLMNGGGVLSMIQVCCIISISCTFAGIFELTGMLRRLESGIAYLGAKAGVFLTITLTALATAALSCNQMLAVILTEQLCNKIQPDKIKMAASLENTAIVIAPLIPWSIAGAVPVATIGAPESCVVAAVYLWMLPIWGILVEKVLRKTYPTIS